MQSKNSLCTHKITFIESSSNKKAKPIMLATINAKNTEILQM